jgi:prophage regulatory protein
VANIAISGIPFREVILIRKGTDVDSELVDSLDLERLTGTKASTWRYWAMLGTGPASFKLGRRRVWRRADVLVWIEGQRAAALDTDRSTSSGRRHGSGRSSGRH